MTVIQAGVTVYLTVVVIKKNMINFFEEEAEAAGMDDMGDMPTPPESTDPMEPEAPLA